MRFVFLLYAALCSASAFGQSIPENPNKTDDQHLRQGKWTIWFDKDWNVVTQIDSVAFYRVVDYKDDKPVGTVTDYFRSGKVRSTHGAIEDHPEEIFDGPYISYHENGRVKKKGRYNKGKPEGDFEFYSADGTVDLYALADHYYEIGLYQKSVPLYEQVKKDKEKKSGKLNNDYAMICIDLAFANRTLGRFAKAEANYVEAIQLYERMTDPDPTQYGRVIGSLGELYYRQGKYKKAEPLLLQSQQMIIKNLGKLSTEYVTSLLNLANMYSELGQKTKAEALFLESKELSEKVSGKKSLEYAAVCHNLAVFYSEAEKTELATPLMTEALEIREQLLGKMTRQYAITCLSLGNIYSKAHKNAEAEKLLVEANDINLSLFSKYHYYYATSCNALARHYNSIGQYTKAEVFAKNAIEAAEKSLGTHNIFYASYCDLLAAVYRNSGLYANAERYYAKKFQTYFYLIENQFAYLSAKEREEFLNTLNLSFEVFNSFALRRMDANPAILGAMYNHQLLTKALLFNTQNKVRKNILSSGDSSLISSFEKWQTRRELLAKVYQMTDEEKKKQNINMKVLEEQANTLEKQLSVKSEAFSRGNDKKRYTWKDVQKKLNRDEAAIEMVRFRWTNKKITDTLYYAALIVTPQSKHPELVVFKNGRAVEKSLTYYRNCIQFTMEDTISYPTFWKPIADKLKALSPRTKKIYFSPDGVYYSLNLQTLLNAHTGNFVADEWDIQMVTNTKDLVVRKEQQAPVANAFLFGYPDYNAVNSSALTKVSDNAEATILPPDSLNTILPKGNIAPLPGTEKEVDGLQKKLQQANWQTTAHLLGQASEVNLKKLQKPKLLHIATHGFFMEEDQHRAGVPAGAAVNPLLRSGLLLAGAQQTLNGKINPDGEDGILTAYEAMNLNLDNTDLVVLSACETGLGEVKNGEGVFGLQRAFQTAGAKSIIMSLWKVSDESTEELMQVFYDRWLATGDKRASFKQAQQQIKNKYKSPYHWGAFVMVGE